MNSQGDLTCVQFIVRKMLSRERALSVVTVMCRYRGLLWVKNSKGLLFTDDCTWVTALVAISCMNVESNNGVSFQQP
jgi:hypothetical protein